MKISFSPNNQAFYDLELNYSDLPKDLIEISAEQYRTFFQALNSDQHVYLKDETLVISTSKPSIYCTWNVDHWVEDIEQASKAKCQENLVFAQQKYDDVSKKITAVLQQIEDEDGDLALLDIQKIELIDYRKKLRAYLKTDGSALIPSTT